MSRKLTLRDKAILIVLLLSAFIYAGYTYLYVPTVHKIDSLNEQIIELSGKDFTLIDDKLKTLETDNTDGLRIVEEIKIAEASNSFDSQMFLMFLSDICNKSSIDLVKFNDLAQNKQDGIWKQRYDFELRGNIGDINKVVGGIDGLKVKYSVNSMSFRQSNNYPFLERFFDGISKLEWYADPVPTPDPEPKPEQELEETEELIEPIMPIAPPTEPIIPPEVTPVPTPIPEAEKTPEFEQKEEVSETNLISEVSSFNSAPRVMFITNQQFVDIFKLCITIEFTMYSDPKTGGAIKSEIL